jgi:predicted dehydrogenase
VKSNLESADRQTSPVRVALIGCGAVVDLLHAPALLARADCRVTLLVDRDTGRTDALKKKFPHAQAATDAGTHLDAFDAAIVAVPHPLHLAVAAPLLKAGKHVLVEKPMAVRPEECSELLAAERAGGGRLSVGQMRRFCPAAAFARSLLTAGALGPIRKVDVRDGVVFGWPVESDFPFRREKCGGGVLMDTGPHTLDMIISWFGLPAALAFRDDARGGVEADAEAELVLPGGAPCFVELSRTRNLRNSAVIEGALGTMEVFFYENKVHISPVQVPGAPFVCQPSPEALRNPSIWRHMFDFQLDDWLASIREGRPSAVPGEEAAKVVGLIQRLYAIRQPLVLPWEVPAGGVS